MDYDTQKEDAYTTSKAALGLIYAFSLLKKTVTNWRLREYFMKKTRKD